MDQTLINIYKDGFQTEDFSLELKENIERFKSLCVDRVISLVLEKKYGIPNKLLIFQEDIMALCSYGAGFTLGEADDIRRAMGKKKMDLMLKFKDRFIEGWTKNVGVFAEEVWDKMVDYAKYCFNKSHGVAYTLVTLKTASLQKYHFDEYMKYNYMNLKNEMKAKAAKLMEERSKKIFPTFKNPYQGIMFGSIEFRELELNEDDNFQMQYNFISDLFLTSDIKYKLTFILRGLYDPWTKDILGLTQLKKVLGKKCDCGPGVIPSTNSFSQFLKFLEMKDYITVKEIQEGWQITKPASRKGLAPTEFVIYKNLDFMPSENRKYRESSMIKQFGVSNTYDFDEFPFEIEEDLKIVVEKYQEVFDKFKENNPDAVINDKVYKLLLSKPTALANRLGYIESKLGVFRASVSSINVMNSGTCKIELQFKNGTKTFFTKDKFIKTKVSKHDVFNFVFEVYSYKGWKDGYFKAMLNLKGVSLT